MTIMIHSTGSGSSTRRGRDAVVSSSRINNKSYYCSRFWAFWILSLVSWNNNNQQYSGHGHAAAAAAVVAVTAFHHIPLFHVGRRYRQKHHHRRRHGFQEEERHQWCCFCFSNNIPTTILSFSSSSDDNNRLKKDGAPPISEPEGTTESSSSSRFKDEADRLLAQARALRQEIASVSESDSQAKTKRSTTSTTASTTTQKPPTSPWNIVTNNDHIDDDENKLSSFADYRLYVDIGREPGTWMEPRWGASGKRIEFTLDVRFCDGSSLANKTIQELMVQDNLVSGKSSTVCKLESAPFARLRNGFDRMSCQGGGGYRIDTARNKNGQQQQQTIRFLVQTLGIGDGDDDGGSSSSSSYGDINVPAGCLYFSLAMFMNSLTQLSKKEGIVSVRQGGWHTGWYRQESRIVGVFRAVPIKDAKRRDGF